MENKGCSGSHSLKQSKREKLLFNFCPSKLVRNFKEYNFLSTTDCFIEHEKIGKIIKIYTHTQHTHKHIHTCSHTGGEKLAL